jgi:hypothetical protein
MPFFFCSKPSKHTKQKHIKIQIKANNINTTKNQKTAAFALVRNGVVEHGIHTRACEIYVQARREAMGSKEAKDDSDEARQWARAGLTEDDRSSLEEPRYGLQVRPECKPLGGIEVEAIGGGMEEEELALCFLEEEEPKIHKKNSKRARIEKAKNKEGIPPPLKHSSEVVECLTQRGGESRKKGSFIL